MYIIECSFVTSKLRVTITYFMQGYKINWDLTSAHTHTHTHTHKHTQRERERERERETERERDD